VAKNPMAHAVEDSVIWGALCEGTHIAGYTFARACRNLEILLEGDRWRLGGRFDDINAFLDSVRLDSLKASAEARKRISNRIKELQPKASNRQIAKTLGVGRSSVDRDTGPNGPRGDQGNQGLRKRKWPKWAI